MRFAGAAGALLLLAVAAPALQAQCQAEKMPGSEWQFVNANTPNEVIIITGGADVRCPDGRRILADEATVMPGRSITLFGNVEVQDPARTLMTDQATFHSDRQLLTAIGNVVVRDRRTGSTLHADLLDYYQETASRPEARMEGRASTNRTRAVLIQEDSAGSAVDAAAADSTVIEATQITVLGEQTFHAVGTAVMTRDSVTTSGQTIRYTQASADAPGTLAVAGDAEVIMPAQQLRGDSIDATVGAGDELREVLTRHNAQLAAEDMQVTAAAIRLFFEEGGVTRMVAMQWPSSAGADSAETARVVAESYRFEADSIDVRAPGQQVTEAIAIGDAYGERLTPDSLIGLLPQLPPEEMAIIASDWMRGDTVRASFAPNPAIETDPEAQQRIMERLSAAGAPAQSVYRMRDEDEPDAPLSISYVSASHIEVTFSDGVVSLVSAAGDAKGTYLQPAALARSATDQGGDPPPGRKQ